MLFMLLVPSGVLQKLQRASMVAVLMEKTMGSQSMKKKSPALAIYLMLC
jgi:hypothetical protein